MLALFFGYETFHTIETLSADGMKYLPSEGMEEASQKRCEPNMASPRGEAVSDS